MFEQAPKTRWFHDPFFWASLGGSVLLNGIGLGVFFFIVLEMRIVAETAPILLVGYGDSSVQGFPIDVVSLDPGAYRQGPENTPGGDNAPLPPKGEALPPPPDTPPEPKKEAEKPPETKPTTEEAAPKKEPAVEDTPPPMPSPAKSAETEKSPGMVAMNDSKNPSGEKTTSNPLPGAPGGANMKIGTPSAGGTVGSRTGVRLPNAPLPPYPTEARRRGLEGKPVVLVSVSADGYVTEATIHKSCGHVILDNAAIEYVKKLRYIPARQNNVPIAAMTYHEVNFHFQ